MTRSWWKLWTTDRAYHRKSIRESSNHFSRQNQSGQARASAWSSAIALLATVMAARSNLNRSPARRGLKSAFLSRAVDPLSGQRVNLYSDLLLHNTGTLNNVALCGTPTNLTKFLNLS